MARRLLIAMVSVLVAAAFSAVVNVATSQWDWTIGSLLVGTVILAAVAQAVISHVERSNSEARVAGADQSEPGVLSRDEKLDLVWRDCAARRVNRLQAAGVPTGRIGAVTAWMDALDDPVVDVPHGQVRVLVAPMGAGKTEQASRWLVEGWYEARDDAEVEVPVWLDARAALPDLEAAVAARLGGQQQLPRRCRVVLDNLDGVGFGRGRELLEEARRLVLIWPHVAVLATSQPGLAVGQGERLDVAPWSVERGRQAVELVTDAEFPYRLVVAETVEVLRSPLLALAVAARLATGMAPALSRWELLSDLARTTLAARRPGQSPAALWPELAQLARLVLDADGEVPAARFGSDPRVWQLADSGLVTETGGRLAFALPVFEQYFGAQAIKEGQVTVEAAAATDAFPRWRYAIAFIIATSTVDEADALMRQLVRANPAAASWVLDEVTAGGKDHSDTSNGPRQAMTTGQHGQGTTAAGRAVAFGDWLRDGQQTWIDGLAPLGSQLARSGDNGRLTRWGVWLDEDYMTLAEAYSDDPPTVVELTEPHPQIGRSTGWARWQGYGALPAAPYGRWLWARQRLREPLERRMRRRTLNLPDGSPLARERVWFLAQLVAHEREDRDHRPIDTGPLRDKVQDMVDRSRHTVSSTWRYAGHDVDKADIQWLHARLQTITDTQLHRPAPLPDQINTGQWAWQAYSPARMLALATQVLHDAVTGYRHLVETNFPSFGPALARYAVLPVRVVGVLEVFDNDADADQSELTYTLQHDPHAVGDDGLSVDLIAVTEPGPLDMTNLWASRHAGPHPRRTAFVQGLTSSMPLELYVARPATNLAYGWLAEDLHALGWLPRDLEFFD